MSERHVLFRQWRRTSNEDSELLEDKRQYCGGRRKPESRQENLAEEHGGRIELRQVNLMPIRCGSLSTPQFHRLFPFIQGFVILELRFVLLFLRHLTIYSMLPCLSPYFPFNTKSDSPIPDWRLVGTRTVFFSAAICAYVCNSLAASTNCWDDSNSAHASFPLLLNGSWHESSNCRCEYSSVPQYRW